MSYRIRSKDGEIRLGSFEELKDAYARQLVDPEDDVQEEGSSQWRKASTYPHLAASRKERSSLLSGTGRWYLLAGVVVILGFGLIAALRSGVVGFIVALGAALLMSGLFTWTATRRNR